MGDEYRRPALRDRIAETIARMVCHPESMYINGPFRHSGEQRRCEDAADQIMAEMSNERVAATTDLRERCAKAAFDAFWVDGTPYTDVERAMFGQVADAVVAELPPSRAAIRSAIAEALEKSDFEQDTDAAADAAADAVLRLIAGGDE